MTRRVQIMAYSLYSYILGYAVVSMVVVAGRVYYSQSSVVVVG